MSKRDARYSRVLRAKSYRETKIIQAIARQEKLKDKLFRRINDDTRKDITKHI